MKEQRKIKTRLKVLSLFSFVFMINFNLSAQDKKKDLPSYPTIQQIGSLSPMSDIIDIKRPKYIETIGFMCKMELEVQKKSKVPVRMRLGSQEYVDKLEKKN